MVQCCGCLVAVTTQGIPESVESVPLDFHVNNTNATDSEHGKIGARKCVRLTVHAFKKNYSYEEPKKSRRKQSRCKYW